ncbi:MAG TPA: hypothetical protein VEQ40_00685 [Pyrinomonadaceae bacterium]|nr:hypothetical protein [Pyrinomonadaceae bacterium]
MKNLYLHLITGVLLFVSHFASSVCRAQEVTEPKDYTINLRGTDGKNYDLNTMRGQVLIVSFGATWCQP